MKRDQRPRLCLPFTILTAPDTVRLIAGEDFRYTLSGPGIERWLPSLLSFFDGRQTLDELLLRVERTLQAPALQLIERLYGERGVVDGPVALAEEGRTYGIRLEGSGKLLEGLKAPPCSGDALSVLCQDRLDYEEALRFNRRSLDGNAPWLWATYGPMSRGYVSPPFLPRAGPCLSCLVRHFQRLSPAAELYDHLEEHARQERPMVPVPFPDEGVKVLCQIVLWKVALLAQKQPPGALYRLHVLDIESMEVSSHRVFPDPECPDCGRRA